MERLLFFSSISSWIFGRVIVVVEAKAPWRWTAAPPTTLGWNDKATRQHRHGMWNVHRGGMEFPANRDDDDQDDDAERYSRQVYALGARAHGLIRTTTVYIDGPVQSGLVYECAKNLALSGIRRIVIVAADRDDANTDDDNDNGERLYHNPHLDDLGRAYQRGARAESILAQAAASAIDDNTAPFTSTDRNINMANQEDLLLLVEYLRRLNPNIHVSSMNRSSLLFDKDHKDETTTTTTLDDVGRATSTTTNCIYLCIDRPYATIRTLNNEITRVNNWPLVAVETAGVFGRVLCDFGEMFVVHDSDGETPAVTPLLSIRRSEEHNEHDSTSTTTTTMMIQSVDGEKHDVSKGDTIRFLLRNGRQSSARCTVTHIYTPYRFAAKLLFEDSPTTTTTTTEEFVSDMRENAAAFCRVKVPLEISFQPIDIVMATAQSNEALFTPSDLEKSFDATRRCVSLACFQALSLYVQTEKRFPGIEDLDAFWERVQSSGLSEHCKNDSKGKGYCRSFILGCAAKFPPIQAIFGAIGAQEVLKAATGLYNPVRQILLFDSDEVLQRGEMTGNLATTVETTTFDMCTGLRYILGDETVDVLEKMQIFIVGAGAIGCEILKNLASMNVGANGRVVLTDMDTIEKSNLSRQLLFRDNDIGNFKSAAAQAAALRMNGNMKIESHSSKVGEVEGNSPFDERFWTQNVDVVLNALDNVDARLFMDKQCVAHKKALVDAGTMGPKGNIQVIVPYESESYASSIDPPEPSIPVCTLKNFPYAISHTIQWGRELFDGLFQRRPEQVNDIVDSITKTGDGEFLAEFLREKGAEAARDAKDELQQDLSSLAALENDDAPLTREEALNWAANLARKLFYTASRELLMKHPPDSVDDDGESFWTGTRRRPKTLEFNPVLIDEEQSAINRNYIDFIRFGARLRMETLLGETVTQDKTSFTNEEVERAFKVSLQIGTTIPSDDSCDTTNKDTIQSSLAEVVSTSRLMAPLEFEKDDESNGHVAFVSAASNLRAIIYGIPPVDVMETRRVAGNIIPAMITTTAFVSALSCIELVKLAQRAKLSLHRNAFINLALPFFAFTKPLSADVFPGFEGKQYTLWDELSVQESKLAASSGGIKMKSLLKRIRKHASDDPSRVIVASVSCGPLMLYASFLHEKDPHILKSSLWDLLTEAVNSSDEFEQENSRQGDSDDVSNFVDHKSYVDLTVVVEDIKTGDEIELPPLRVKRYQQ